LGDYNLRTQLTNYRHELATEKAERINDNGALRSFFQKMEGTFLHQLRDVRCSLDTEVATRIEADKQLEAKLKKNCSGFRDHTDFEKKHERGISDLQQHFEKGCKEQSTAIEEALRAAKQAKQLYDRELREREALEEKTAQSFQELLRMFEEYKNESTLAEREERHNAHEVLDRTVDSVEQRLRDFNAAIDAKYEEHYTMYEQFEIKLASSVDRAAHQARMGRAPHDNTKALADLSERLKSVSGRLTTEMQERTASFEDLAAHIQDLRVMMEDVQNKQELHDATAKAERTRYQHGFMIANQGIEEGVSLSCEHNKISQQLEELRLSIKTESEKRAVLHEELKEACGGQSSSLLSQLKHQLDAELISRSKVVTDLVERVNSLAEGLVLEVQERRTSNEEIGKRLQDLSSSIVKESSEREAVALRSREQLALNCKELVSERALHNHEITSLMGNLESWKGHVNQQLSDLRCGIELEIDIRQAADEKIEKLCLTTHGKMNEVVR